MLHGNHVNLAVIGGNSLVTPALLSALQHAVSTHRLPPTHVRLWGRDQLRLQRIRDVSIFMLTAQRPSQPRVAERSVEVSIHSSLQHAVSGATHILCQVRPGGMAARARDERMALHAGVPGDEGIGPGGLAAFLRGRHVIRDMLQICAAQAPSAIFLQMTSPLGLMTALADRYYPARAYGVCELPATVSSRVLSHVQSRIGRGPLTCSLAGLNHQSWLYAFRDRDDVDRTADVLRAIDDNDLVGVDAKVIVEYGAVPMPYLRLYLHLERELERQRSAPRTRGEELILWSQRLNAALESPTAANMSEALSLISLRKPDWYRDGVVPVLEALASCSDTVISLNVPNRGALPGISRTAIVETLCLVRSGKADPLTAFPLPEKPARLTGQLVDYEQAALAVAAAPTEQELRDVLALHPLVPRQAITILAGSLHEQLQIPA